MPLRALTLEVEAGAAQAMSDALVEAGAQSVWIENLDAERPTLQVLVSRSEDGDRIVRTAAAAAGIGVPRFTVDQLLDQDWVRRSQAQFAPVEIGRRLWVGPSWQRPAPDRIAVRLDPGLAFGTGTHPSTRLVLGFLEDRIEGGERVLDYGCGSGILGIAAARLGAACVDAVDIDSQAVETATDNARANGVDMRVALPEALPAATYDIVVSNILAQPLIVLAPLLAARAAPRARIALSGILESQAADVAAAYARWFDVETPALEEGWALVAGVRR